MHHSAPFAPCPDTVFVYPPRLAHQSTVVSDDPSVLNSAAGAAVYARTTLDECKANPFHRLLTKADTGYELRAVIEYPGGTTLESGSKGPVEAAPPHARELWIEGSLEVGQLLVANLYYFGGVQGRSQFSWVGIGADGTRASLKSPTPCDPEIALPDASDVEACTGPEWDSDPRCLRVTSEMAGWYVKVKAVPTRADGLQGYPLTSKPKRIAGGDA